MVAPKTSLRIASAAWVLSALLAGCGTESGILVDITRDESVTEPIEEVSIIIGTPEQRDGVYQRDVGASLEQVAISEGRDLMNDPYRLLIHPGGGESSVMIVAIAWKDGQPIAAGALSAPQAFLTDKIVQVEVVLTTSFPGEILPTGCVKWDGGRIVPAIDLDCDGDAVCATPGDAGCDCNDLDPGIGPSAVEDCFTDTIDEDCDGDPIEDVDADMDGVTRCFGDCDDADPEVHEGKQEKCDGKDNDCDSVCDDGYDYDGDLYTTCGTLIEGETCAPAEADCDDTNPFVHPGHAELCDGVDNDCNGLCDDDFALDVDGDFFTPCGTIFGRCGDPMAILVDCEPEAGWAHPFADEICDGLDTNCDGTRLTQLPCYLSETTGMESSCEVGVAPCDDDLSDGTYSLGSCGHSADLEATPAPIASCDAYETCFDLGDIDPWSCAIATAIPDVTMTCNVYYSLAPLPNLCPERAIPLIGSPTGTGCEWWIHGGMNQRHYNVGLTSSTMMTPQPRLDGCAGQFNLIGKRDLVPMDESIAMSYTEFNFDPGGQPITLIRMEFYPVEVDDCTGFQGLECSPMIVAIP